MSIGPVQFSVFQGAASDAIDINRLSKTYQLSMLEIFVPTESMSVHDMQGVLTRVQEKASNILKFISPASPLCDQEGQVIPVTTQIRAWAMLLTSLEEITSAMRKRMTVTLLSTTDSMVQRLLLKNQWMRNWYAQNAQSLTTLCGQIDESADKMRAHAHKIEGDLVAPVVNPTLEPIVPQVLADLILDYI